jgi:MinD-like ATPase involved in chromosome partitioning or flagellar assembly
MADEQTPEEAAEAEAARRRASAQSAAGDLARMGIDPRALGLQAPPPERPQQPRGPAQGPVQGGHPLPPAQHGAVDAGDPAHATPPAEPGSQGNVVPIRRDQPTSAHLPASGTSAAWAPAPPPIGAASADAATREVPVEFLLGRTGAKEFTRPAPAQLARAVTYGMLTPDAAQAAEREREMVNRVRARQSEQRVVVFLSGKGGVGTTSVAVGVGCVLAALRDDATTLVSLRPGTPSLGLALAGTPAPNAREFAREESEVTPLRLNNGLRLVDGPRWGTPVRRNDVPRIVDRIGQQSTFLLGDVGNDASEAGHSILSRADQVVIVSPPGTDGIDASRVAAERVAEIDPYLLDTAICVVVCPRESAHRVVVRRMREQMPGGARIVSVPPESSLADGDPFDPASVSVGTRLAMIDVAGLVALGATAQGLGR